ncbi:uncharacterized protein ACLA_098040 [Aspergillus clavatus NRRL 1]|uniref:Uncharacterized protein n=1 Tax=Aspergillus clavatus (strain ATCC 1007 / CBS 513.65 / DSM 816 / NCTC 3887 / NRRL 1 / QM 1276 / 107) TaxID=344612 RepID=A1CMS5_ASPCL|nr:uncharacterized protein ACLA_098040 [Aspergillus clavatus NRRL 1]EAW08862.1 conserved hypothetical protein [Aspergillus clavatus NRRL 1]
MSANHSEDGLDGQSSQTPSSPASVGEVTRSARSNSIIEYGARMARRTTPESPTGGVTLEKKESFPDAKQPEEPPALASAQGNVVKCIRSPGDYVFLDLDSKNKSDEQDVSNESNDTSQELESGEEDLVESDANELDRKNALEQKLKEIRQIVANEIQMPSEDNKEHEKKAQISKRWDAKSMRCSMCRGDCPVCGKTCCIYSAARCAIVEAKPDTELFRHAKEILQMILARGNTIMGQNKFSLCTTHGGCGRYVCSACWGICPVELCQDVQCKECKKDPWAACDWHDY